MGWFTGARVAPLTLTQMSQLQTQNVLRSMKTFVHNYLSSG